MYGVAGGSKTSLDLGGPNKRESLSGRSSLGGRSKSLGQTGRGSVGCSAQVNKAMSSGLYSPSSGGVPQIESNSASRVGTSTVEQQQFAASMQAARDNLKLKTLTELAQQVNKPTSAEGLARWDAAQYREQIFRGVVQQRDSGALRSSLSREQARLRGSVGDVDEALEARTATANELLVVASQAAPVDNNVGNVASVAQVARVVEPIQLVQRVAAFRANRFLASLSLIVTGSAWVISLACQSAYQEMRSCTMDCPRCKGFGIHRCPLCAGKGVHTYELKFEHNNPCSECYGKRYLPCQCCGGKYHRSMFQHHRRQFKVREETPTLTDRFED